MSTPSSTRLGIQEKLAYGLGDTASNFYFVAFNLFLSYYYTDIAGLPAAAVGTLMFIVPTTVAFLNPVIGMLADRTDTRWGKFRPYLLWGALPYGILGVVMFVEPAWGPAGRLAYAYVTYTLALVAYAVINTPYGALMGVMSPSSSDRTSLSAYRFACASSGGLFIGWLVPLLKTGLAGPGGSPADGFRHTMTLFAAVSVGMFLYTFARTRERVAPPASQESSVRRDLRDLAGNRPWWVLFVSSTLVLINVGLRSGSGVYYFKYCVHDELAQGTFNLLGSVGFVTGTFMTRLFTRYCPRPRLLVILSAINAASMAAFYFVDPHQRVVLYVLQFAGSFLAGPTPAIVWSLYADTADYGEWKFGRRATGLVMSASVFATKLGLAVGSALVGWLLDYHGFVANTEQTPAARHGITLLFSLLPALFGLLSGLVLLGYRLDEPRVREIELALAARKAGPTPAPSL